MHSLRNFGADWRYRIPNRTIQTHVGTFFIRKLVFCNHFGTFFVRNWYSGPSKPSGPGLRSSQGRFFHTKIDFWASRPIGLGLRARPIGAGPLGTGIQGPGPWPIGAGPLGTGALGTGP